MAVKTYCQACCRILQVPESAVERHVRCRCGNSFRVEKPLAQVREEERRDRLRRRGEMRIDRVARRGLGRPVYRRLPLGGGLLTGAAIIIAILYLDASTLRAPARRADPVRVRLLLADPISDIAETGVDVRAPIRPPANPGETAPAESPGETDRAGPSDLMLAASQDPRPDRQGAPSPGKWRLVPEEAKRLWDLEGLLSPRREGREEPDQVLGVGSPPEGAQARPSDPDQAARRDAEGRPGSTADRRALERLVRAAGGGGVRFFGTPLSLEGAGVVFLIDRSASMLLPVAPPRDAADPDRKWTKFDLAKWELMKAIALLPEEKVFNVIFFDECVERWRYRMHPARPSSKRDCYDWIDTARVGKQTNVSEAVLAAFEMEGEHTIVLLSDGRPNVIDCRTMLEVPSAIHLEKIRQSNEAGAPIWCFGFDDDEESTEFLRRLAETTGGRYTPISAGRF